MGPHSPLSMGPSLFLLLASNTSPLSAFLSSGGVVIGLKCAFCEPYEPIIQWDLDSQAIT